VHAAQPAARLESLEHAQPLQDVRPTRAELLGARHGARKARRIHPQHPPALPGEQRRRGAARRPGADDKDIPALGYRPPLYRRGTRSRSIAQRNI